MTRVDFYIAKQMDILALACRVIEKIYALEHSIYVYTESAQQTSRIDELLWTFKQNNFIPHEPIVPTQTQQVPVLIGQHPPPATLSDVLVNLTDAVPIFFNRFARVAEVVGPVEEKKKIARARFKYYRENGYALHTHNI